MTVIRWAARTLVRSPLRTLLLVGVLGVSIGLALIMITVNGAFAERVDDIAGQVGTTVTVRPAGSFGGFGVSIGGPGGAGPGTDQQQDDSEAVTLTDDQVAAIESVDYVESYSRSITEQYSGDSLVTSIEPPPGLQLPEGAEFRGPPILITGTDDATALSNFAVQEATIADGRAWTSDETGANVVVVGEGLAEANNLSVGDTVDFSGTSVEVIGIFSTGTQFGDNGAFMPLEAAREIFDRGGEVDEVSVKADSSDHVGAVADGIRAALGEDVADVTSDEAAFDAIAAPLKDAEDSSRIGMIAALIASAAIILFSIGIVARQRVKEIGILKAVGASNWHVVSQLAVETAMIAVVAAVIGAAATFPLAQTVADGLVSDTASAPSGPFFNQANGDGGVAAQPGAGPIIINGGPGGAAVDNSGVLGDVDVAVSPEVFAYALAIAFVLALLATVGPAWYVGRVRPAEVLRYE